MKKPTRRRAALVAGVVVSVLAVGVPVRADSGCGVQGQGEMRLRGLEVRIHNATGCRLTLTGYGLTWGEYVTGPTAAIPKGQNGGFKAQSRAASFSGVEGFVKYASSNCDESRRNQHTATLNFDLPPVGTNTYTVDGSGAFESRLSGGSGAQAVLMWGLSKR
ncbi:hypothetical protein ACFV2X_48985 [Streptomyces sp. NPDC059679]|uniref:hypothetical protein n=1 Tax=Streptomyces sp. NPDC059679 TaxID=3346903 RepID=UPI0036AB7FB8